MKLFFPTMSMTNLLKSTKIKALNEITNATVTFLFPCYYSQLKLDFVFVTKNDLIIIFKTAKLLPTSDSFTVMFDRIKGK